MSKRAIIIVLLVAVACRLGMLAAAWQNPAGVFTPDSQDYITLSKSIAGGEFYRGGGPEIFRTPGYPLFLLLTGSAGENWPWQLAIAIQAALDVLLVYLTYRLGLVVFGRPAAIAAAAFGAVSPLAISSSLRILSDSMFAVLLVLAMLMIALYQNRPAWRYIFAAALAMAAACYVRPVGQVYIAVLAVFVAVQAIKKIGHVKMAALFVLISVGLLGPWIIRNSIEADYTGFSSFAGDSVYFFAAPEVLAKQGQISSSQARELVKQWDEADLQNSPDRTPGAAAKFRKDRAGAIIKTDWLLYLRLHLKGVIGFFMPAANDTLEVAGLSSGQKGTSDVLRQQGVCAAAKHYFGGNAWAIVLAVPIVVLCGLQYIFAAAGVVKKIFRAMPALGWLMLVMVVLTSLLSGPYGFPRYRVGVEPMINIFAGVGLMMLISKAGFGIRHSGFRASSFNL